MYQVDSGAYWQAQLMFWGPKIAIAILILVATWIVARAVGWVLRKAIDRSPALKRHVTGTPEETVGHQLGTIAKLIIWLVGIMAALRFLGVGQILAPINELVTEIFAFLPHLIAAGLIFFVGLVVARIVRRLVETVLIAANVDGLLARIGIGSTEGTVRNFVRSSACGHNSRCNPRQHRPRRRRARLCADHHSGRHRCASGAGNHLDFRARDCHAGPDPRGHPPCARRGIVDRHCLRCRALLEDDHRSHPSANWLRRRESARPACLPPNAFPSRIVANIAMIAIILAAAIEAASQLGGGTVAIFLAQVTELGGKVIFGSLIIVVGIFLARIVANLVGSGTGEGGYAQTLVRYSIIALFTAIGLTFMGLADRIVMLAFGLILGSAAVACALAFGLGGRDAAARILERWSDTGQPPVRPAPPRRIRAAPPEDEQPPLV